MRSWKLGALAPTALMLSLPAAPQALAAGTDFLGTVTVTMNISLRQAVTGSQSIFCGLSLSGGDSGGESFKGERIVAATKKSSTSYTCTVLVPYNWDDQFSTGDTLNINTTYTAAIYDSSLPSAIPAIATASGTWQAASNVAGTIHPALTTTIALY